MRTFKPCMVLALLCLFCASAFAGTIPAADSSRTEGGGSADTPKSDSSKLSVRRSSLGAKSWIKFDLGSLEVGRLATATLTVVFIEAEGPGESFDVSFVNDDCLDNIGWTRANLTWNNAPGNDTASLANLNPTKTTLLPRISLPDAVTIGQAVVIDVLPALKSDTDGIVQFVLHNSSVLMNFGTHNHSNAAYRPFIEYTEMPLGAKNPVPGNKARVETTQPGLSWTNPDPNDGASPITCTVYFGEDPNRPQMDKVTLPAGASSVALTAANFPRFLPLVDDRQYFWVVDCVDPSMDAGERFIEGVMWSFFTDNNESPTVNAGEDQVTWLGKSGTPGQEVIQLQGIVSDDGLPDPPASLTLLWTQVAGDSVVITPADQAAATVTITARGDYQFTLTADDSVKRTSDTVRIVVGATACDASHLSTGNPYNVADANQDCIVDLEDFAAVIAANWLNCTDTLTDCAN